MFQIIAHTTAYYNEHKAIGERIYVDGRFLKTSIPVLCSSGVYADASTGRRLKLRWGCDDIQEYVYDDGPFPMYVNGKTRKTYYSSACFLDRDNRKLVYRVYSSNIIKKHGLVWNKVFECKISADSDVAEQNGILSLESWIGSKGEKYLEPVPMLKAKEIPTAKECIRFIWGDNPSEVLTELDAPQNATIGDLLKLWCNGSVARVIKARKKRFDFRSQPWGIEIEFYGIKREEAAAIVAETLGTTARRRGKTRTYDIIDCRGRWAITYDSSIKPRKSTCNGEDCEKFKCELVTPILSYEDIPIVQKIIRRLREAGMRVNDSCGIHVHVSADRHTAHSLSVLTKIMASHEDLLFKALAVKDKRIKAYCKKVDPRFIEAVSSVRNNTNIDQMKALWYGDGNYYTCSPSFLVIIYKLYIHS